MEQKEKSPVIRFWPQLLLYGLVCIGIGESLNRDEGFLNRMNKVEEEHIHDVEYLNEEDNGVRGDFNAADACNKEIAELQNQVLYWKLKYELKTD